jgi:hypothetical protein
VRRRAAFPSAEVAISWGFERVAFDALAHARNACEKLKREKDPQGAREMARLWVAEVQVRLPAGAEDDGKQEERASVLGRESRHSLKRLPFAWPPFRGPKRALAVSACRNCTCGKQHTYSNVVNWPRN